MEFTIKLNCNNCGKDRIELRGEKFVIIGFLIIHFFHSKFNQKGNTNIENCPTKKLWDNLKKIKSFLEITLKFCDPKACKPKYDYNGRRQ